MMKTTADILQDLIDWLETERTEMWEINCPCEAQEAEYIQSHIRYVKDYVVGGRKDNEAN